MFVEPESDLHWRAFLYVAGECSADEASAFEQILQTDQTAREAVALAVELVEAVGVLGAEAALILQKPKRSQRVRSLVWAVSLAAAVVVGAGLIFAPRSSEIGKPDPSEVALRWSGIRDGIDADWKAVVAGPMPVDSSLGLDADSGVENAIERPLPSWLLSAASVPRSEPAPEEN